MPRRYGIILVSGITLAACAAVVFSMLLLLEDKASVTSLIILLGIVAAAFLCYLGVSLVVPSLHPSPHVGWPMNLTLPIVFDSIVLLLMLLLADTGSPITVAPQQLRFVDLFVRGVAPYAQETVWPTVRVFGAALVLQVALMSLLRLLSTGPSPGHGGGPA